MASEAEVLKHTGYRIGAVSPFGLPRPIRILIDPAVLAEAEISIGSGVPSAGLILARADLRRGLPMAETVPLLEGA